MINYLKLQFSYLFSKIFTLIFLFVLILILVGVVFSANLDLGYAYLDGFRTRYFHEFLQQSFLIIEVILTVFLIFISSILCSKTNEALIVYSVEDYYQRLKFLFSRVLVSAGLNLVLIFCSFSFVVIIGSYFTPFIINSYDIFLILTAISFKIWFFQVLVIVLQAIANHFLITLLPVLLFWFHKTINNYDDIENAVSEMAIKFVPSFTVEINEIVFYESFYKYLIIAIIGILIAILINQFKDYS